MKRLAVQLNRSSLFKLSPHKRHTVFILSLILGSNTTAVALTKLLSGMPFDVKESAEIHYRFDSMSVGRGVHDYDIIESGESVSLKFARGTKTKCTCLTPWYPHRVKVRD
jgi:hypothetical protein